MKFLSQRAIGFLLLGIGCMTSSAMAEDGLTAGLVPPSFVTEGAMGPPSPETGAGTFVESEGFSPFSVNYYAVMFGSSLQRPTQFQPSPTGEPDLTRPVMMKNFLSFSYALDQRIALSATAFGIWAPALKQQFIVQDPFLMVSDSSWFQLGNLNIYGDLRFHLPVTSYSRASNLMMGLQTFQVITYGVGNGRLLLGLNSSLRTNFYGKNGSGTDLELYLAPNLRYQLSSTVAMTVLYEMQGSHIHKGPRGILSDGTDLQPGISWDVLPNLNLNPFLTLQTGGKVNWRTTSAGLFMSWGLI